MSALTVIPHYPSSSAADFINHRMPHFDAEQMVLRYAHLAPEKLGAVPVASSSNRSGVVLGS